MGSGAVGNELIPMCSMPSTGLCSKEWSMAEEDFGTIETAEPVAIEQLIERWWMDHFPGSAIARDTQAWNVAHAAKERLKRLLKRSV
jgi:hypothetical protein